MGPPRHRRTGIVQDQLHPRRRSSSGSSPNQPGFFTSAMFEGSGGEATYAITVRALSHSGLTDEAGSTATATVRTEPEAAVWPREPSGLDTKPIDRTTVRLTWNAPAHSTSNINRIPDIPERDQRQQQAGRQPEPHPGQQQRKHRNRARGPHRRARSEIPVRSRRPPGRHRHPGGRHQHPGLRRRDLSGQESRHGRTAGARRSLHGRRARRRPEGQLPY